MIEYKEMLDTDIVHGKILRLHVENQLTDYFHQKFHVMHQHKSWQFKPDVIII